MYIKFFKRVLDIICATAAIIVFSWLFAVIAIFVKVKLGGPVIFMQKRPGYNEKIFTLYKFRTMTNEVDKNGKPLSDAQRLTEFGRLLRLTSLDELPEAWNILMGDMSIIGPRPQLVKDLVFMTEEQRKRHDIRPGLSGLAQIRGRNAISWEKRIEADLEYIQNVSFIEDVKILFMTIKKFISCEDVTSEGMDTSEDLGDYLLRTGLIDRYEYDNKIGISKALLTGAGKV